jgi:hypothetical protein
MGLGLGRADEDGEVEYQGKVDDVVRGIIRGRQGSGEGAEIGSTRFLLVSRSDFESLSSGLLLKLLLGVDQWSQSIHPTSSYQRKGFRK